MATPEAPSSAPAGGFEVVLRHIEQQILAGAYPVGSRLPPERELAVELGVGRGAVREALRALAAQGILTSTTGPGNGSRVSGEHVDAIGRILKLHLALQVVQLDDLTETRVALERAAVAAAARTQDRDELASASALQERMLTTDHVDEFNELDTDFHVALARAGGNQLLSDLTVAIRQCVATPIRSAEDTVTDWPAVQRRLIAQHGEILAAVTAGDATGAAELVEHHIRDAWSVLLGQRPALS